MQMVIIKSYLYKSVYLAFDILKKAMCAKGQLIFDISIVTFYTDPPINSSEALQSLSPFPTEDI
ncbi:hypothetical protein ABID22_004113 [Pontibacter aydingkolensis]